MSPSARDNGWELAMALIHRVRSPLMVISGQAEMLSLAGAAEDVRSSASAIVAQVERAKGLLEELVGVLERLERDG